MYRIGEFSKMGQVSIKTLRYYDEVNILKPEEIDIVSGYRYYTTRQLVILHEIQFYRQIGCSLQEIKQILKDSETMDILINRQKEIEERLKELSQQHKQIDLILNKEKMNSKYKAILKEIPRQIIYAKKLVVSSYDEYLDKIPQIGEKLAELNPTLKCATPEYCYISYLGDIEQGKKWEVEYCEAVDRMGIGCEEIEFRESEPIQVVSVMHKGSYNTLRLAFAYAIDWVEKNGYLMNGYPRESYIDGIWNKEDENEWLTEVQIPISK
ncbi:MerR family transcriptional regulator [Anaerorhabdus furcosa]|uniref:DNA-binding transcriptional regulator, MerR family n=1 Tax=Anaerorhabdus furcosa TaxID=118967 RepID=A0A1T4KD43_9FIRM|nr:MerR family transcriptional regulator [Anaerorhabdus furcosa]SJZ40243.1 DNA-binding transcriptional regulator, MerR family [Anaerorhabdus furcosa]